MQIQLSRDDQVVAGYNTPMFDFRPYRDAAATKLRRKLKMAEKDKSMISHSGETSSTVDDAQSNSHCERSDDKNHLET